MIDTRRNRTLVTPDESIPYNGKSETLRWQALIKDQSLPAFTL